VCAKISPQGEGISANPTASGWGIKKISINVGIISNAAGGRLIFSIRF
jgi:hypothetical protein